jgi:hypothetical protein
VSLEGTRVQITATTREGTEPVAIVDLSDYDFAVDEDREKATALLEGAIRDWIRAKGVEAGALEPPRPTTLA